HRRGGDQLVQCHRERPGFGKQQRLVALAPVLHQRDVGVGDRGGPHEAISSTKATRPARSAARTSASAWAASRARPIAAPPPPAPVSSAPSAPAPRSAATASSSSGQEP